jgi:hypothetical protein
MVFSGQTDVCRRKQLPETHAMDRWIALGIFLLGTGVGALTTVALYAEQIRRLRTLREAASHDGALTVACDNSPIEAQGDKSDRRKSA